MLTNPLIHPTSSSIHEGLQGNPVSRHLQDVSTKTRTVLIQTMEEELSYHGITELKPFFVQFPNAWYDLKRKIHKYAQYSNQKSWYIDASDEDAILATFLRLHRADDTGEHIRKNIHKEIFKNKTLTAQISQEPSILDTSHHDIQSIPSAKQIEFIQSIITLGIHQNHTDTSELDVEGHFRNLFPGILKYLQSIFDIRFPASITQARNIYVLAVALKPIIWNKKLRAGGGTNAKNAWKLVQAFSAWGALPDIILMHQQATEIITNLPSRLRDVGIEMRNIDQTVLRFSKNDIEEETSIYSGIAKILLKDQYYFNFHIDYRSKTIRSILLKMWENEEYNTVDALRDMIGAAIRWSDNTPEEKQVEIINSLTNLMPNYGYLLKSKGLINKEGQKQIKIFLKQPASKKPLGTSFRYNKKSNPLFRNMSISGFVTIQPPSGGPNDHPVTCGCEIQAHNQSGYDWWKSDHYRFDPRKIISVESRGDCFITTMQALRILQREIGGDILNTILQSTIQLELKQCIDDGFLIPYAINTNEIVFTTKDYENGFLQRFRSDVIKLDKRNVMPFIDSISLSDSSIP